MKRKYRSIYIFLSCLFMQQVAVAQTSLPAMFADNMVLQQQQQVAIWGKDKSNTTITVKGSWGNTAKVTADDKGQWKLKLQTPSAGGPYTLQLKGSSKLNSNNVLSGKVLLGPGPPN